MAGVCARSAIGWAERWMIWLDRRAAYRVSSALVKNAAACSAGSTTTLGLRHLLHMCVMVSAAPVLSRCALQVRLDAPRGPS